MAIRNAAHASGPAGGRHTALLRRGAPLSPPCPFSRARRPAGCRAQQPALHISPGSPCRGYEARRICCHANAHRARHHRRDRHSGRRADIGRRGRRQVPPRFAWPNAQPGLPIGAQRGAALARIWRRIAARSHPQSARRTPPVRAVTASAQQRLPIHSAEMPSAPCGIVPSSSKCKISRIRRCPSALSLPVSATVALSKSEQVRRIAASAGNS